jgi:hypothetical protein
MTTKKQLLLKIRYKGLGCCNGSNVEVLMCTISECRLYLFRLGKDTH